MGHIPDYVKATDGELNQEISFCRSILDLIKEAIEAGALESDDKRVIFKDRLHAAEQELERRFLLS